jgi:hypothetical protein
MGEETWRYSHGAGLELRGSRMIAILSTRGPSSWHLPRAFCEIIATEENNDCHIRLANLRE